VYSAYTPPAPKKKPKVERTRFRETTHTFRQKSPQAAPPPAPAAAAPEVVKASAVKTKKHGKGAQPAVEKPGKKEKIRFGQKPRETLPSEPNGTIENAGALPETASNAAEPVNPLEAAAPEKKTRFSAHAKEPKQPKPQGPQPDALAPPAADAAEVADRATQSGPLGLAGDTASKKKKKSATEGEKTRLADRKKEPEAPQQPPQFTPAPEEPGAPAPARQDQGTPAPTPQPQQ
jgi:peptidyl-prolyl cis-trans isomerase SurA